MKSKSKKISSKPWLPKAAKLTLVGAIAAALNPASALEVTGSFSGFWDQPDQENHGMIISVSRLATGESTGVAYWAFYDEVGNSRWLLAQGPIVGDRIEAEVFEVDGVTFLQPNNPDVNPVNPIGTMQIQFDNCDNGNVSFNTPQVIVGTGGFRISRITTQPGVNCSGGISDNIEPGAIPEEFDIDLLPTGVFPDASGDVEYKQRPGRAELEVEVEDLPVGEYTLQVGGITRGIIQVRAEDDGDTKGEIEFSSPQDDDDLLLDFDPRDQIIDVLQGTTVVLTTIAPAVGTPPGSGQGNPPAFGGDDIDIDLNNDGVYPDGEGEADLDFEDDRVEFEVEIEDVPVGSYTLLVGGVERGQIQVVTGDDDTEGEIEFVFPATPGTLLLDFDPRGQLIEVFEQTTRIFSADFPLVDDDDDDDDGNDDGGSDDDDDDDNGNDDGGNDDDDDDDGNDDGGNDDDDDDDGGDNGSPTSDIDVDLNNDGVFPDGSASADYDLDASGADFDVSVEDIPVGTYNLVVDGQVRGQIEVTSDDDDDEGDGDISFSNPVEDDDLLLDFDPRGTLVEIFDGETRLFFVDFPQE